MSDWSNEYKYSPQINISSGGESKPKSSGTKELQEVAIRGLISRVAGDWAPLIDAGMTLMGGNTTEQLKAGKDFLGNVAKGYWTKMGEDPARATYSRLTEKANPKQQAGSVQSGRPRPEDTFFNPGGDVLLKSTQDLKDRGWRRGFYENPEITASVVGATTAAAPLIAGGAFLSAFAQGEKPRSDYAYPVEPSRGGYDDVGGMGASSNAYNPSVESARASAQFKHQLQEQKHEHDIQLQLLRNQNHTPGVQSPMGSSMPNVSSADPFGMDMFGGSKRYF